MEKMKAKPQLSLSEALKEAMSKLTVMKGRSRRSEFWWTALVAAIFGWVIGFIPILGGIVTILLTLAMIPLAVRRLHDAGHSGWWYAVSLVLGWITGGIYIVKMMPIFEKMADNANAEKMLDKMMEVYSDPLVVCLMLVSFILGIIMLVFFCQDSKPYPNKWGVSPKYDSDEIEVIE
ncbi:MAG: DUF805 domain-containing protein [Prevotella sp.]|nr:DUF805 domain-containing protein [Prevotella sp.]